MLINESILHQHTRVNIMSELAILAALTKSTLSEVSKQASALAAGLQNAAPGVEKISVVPNKSIQYLVETSEELTKSCEECEQFLTPSSDENLSHKNK